MRTAVVSDLHLGSRSGNDLLRRTGVRRVLLDALDGVERVIILGDLLELREHGLDEGQRLAAPFFEELGEALGGGEVVVVPGNHDHALAEPVLSAAGGAAGLGLETRATQGPGDHLGPLAERLRPARLELAYPGLWLDEGVYATHGHYLDLHSSVPAFECLSLAAAARVVGEPPDDAAPADYERVAAPVYRAAAGLGQMSRPGGAALGADLSRRAWGRLRANGGGASSLSVKLLASALPGAVDAVNRLGLGPFAADLSASALRRSGLRAIGEVVRRLRIDADVVVFGHTHRAGPFPGEEDDWLAPTGARLVNAGNWMYEQVILPGPPGRSPYWPGTCLFLDAPGEPRLERLLDDVPHEELRVGAD